MDNIEDILNLIDNKKKENVFKTNKKISSLIKMKSFANPRAPTRELERKMP